MTTFNRIKKLAEDKKITLKELARQIGLGENAIYKWQKQTPSSEALARVADYFNVSTDYLLGRTDKKYWELNEKDEKYIQDKLQEFIADISNADALSFSKGTEPLSEKDKELLVISMENSLRLGKEMAKKKFTAKKYRGDES